MTNVPVLAGIMVFLWGTSVNLVGQRGNRDARAGSGGERSFSTDSWALSRVWTLFWGQWERWRVNQRGNRTRLLWNAVTHRNAQIMILIKTPSGFRHLLWPGSGVDTEDKACVCFLRNLTNRWVQSIMMKRNRLPFIWAAFFRKPIT